MDSDGVAVFTADERGSVEAGQGPEAALPTPSLAPLRPPLASLLVERGVASQEQLDDALAEAHQTGEHIREVVVRRGWINEAQLADVLARQWQLPFAALSTIRVDPEAQGLMSQEDAVSLGAWPVGFMAGALLVAVADPEEARFASVRETLGRECTFLVTTPSALSQLIEENSAPGTGDEVAFAANWPEPAGAEAEPPAESWPATREIASANGFEYEPAVAFEHQPAEAFEHQPTEAFEQPTEAFEQPTVAFDQPAAAFESHPPPTPETVLPVPIHTVAGDESTPVLEELDRLFDRLLAERESTRDELVACRHQLEALREEEARLEESIRRHEAKAIRDEQHLESMRSKLAGMCDSLAVR